MLVKCQGHWEDPLGNGGSVNKIGKDPLGNQGEVSRK